MGGIIANLLLGLILFGWILCQPLQEQQDAGWLASLAGYSLLVCIINLLPFRTKKGMASDGLLLWRFCRSGREFQERREVWERYQSEVARQKAVAAMHERLMNNERPRLWESSLIDTAMTMEDGTRAEAVACYYGYLWAADMGDMAAGQYLDRAVGLRGAALDIENALLMEKAFWSALHDHDEVTAQDWLGQVGNEYEETSTHWRARAALSLAAGNRTEALLRAHQAQTRLKPTNPPDRCLLDLLLNVASVTEADLAFGVEENAKKI